jgi:hypothetical protein
VPNWYSHVPAAEQTAVPGHCDATVQAAPSFEPPTHCWKHGVLVLHTIDVLLLQRWSFRSLLGPGALGYVAAFRLSTGPRRVQTPHGRLLPVHVVRPTVILPRSTIVASWP